VQIDQLPPAIPATGQPPAAAPLSPLAPPASPESQQSQQSSLPGASTPWPADGNLGPATQALNALEGAGYGAFTNFRPKGSGFEATVQRDGRLRNVFIDPVSGSVTPED
jgi:hypothetical protein